MSDSAFYRAFEDRHRGPRELIRARLEVYKPFIVPLADLHRPAQAVDLGCGRGEWLELLRDREFEPCGVDLDEGMLAACIERGLPARQGDAIEYLKALGDETQSIVSGFHIVEHIPFESLDTLVAEALRVLKPGGLLILETPNPENVVVGTCNFYLDPTHTRPIPPALLSFLPEYHGYGRVRVIRLQEDKSLHERKDVGLIEVLGGVSPDYAVVAQKKAAPDIMVKFDAVFAADYGLALHQLASRYDQNMERTANELRQRLANAEAQAGGMADALSRITVLQDRLITAATEQAQTQAKALAAESRAQEAESRAQEAESRIAVMRSLSWRITAPLRFVAGLLIHSGASLRNSANHAVHCTVETCQRPLSGLMAAVLRRPKLAYRINQFLMRYPGLYQQLLGVARRQGVVPGSPHYVAPTAPSAQIVEAGLENLSPHARRVYADLKTAIEKHKRHN